MAVTLKKTVRKLVTLPADLAERVEDFRITRGISTESDALKVLIEDGLKTKDKPSDLFKRCQTATARGQSVGDIINFLTADHPLITSTTIDADYLYIYLGDKEEQQERFLFNKSSKKWVWQEYQYGEWRNMVPLSSEGAKLRTKREDLDEDIPF
ncbi:hypothetical protein [Ferrovibrio sp.]|uniref:hypothetical protein n=1 Tax=Ferrovibrio sp. TaxID=1917215 RepID=UPI003D12A065